MHHKLIFFTGLFLFLAPAVFANDLVYTEINRPYEVVDISKPLSESFFFLGELVDFPVMYGTEVYATTSITLQLQQAAVPGVDPNAFSLLVVRKNTYDGGVQEVARSTFTTNDWQFVERTDWGIAFWQSDSTAVTLSPGAYRFEVSTPENRGKYLLQFGESTAVGYVATIAQAHQIQEFYGYSPLRILTSSHVYYPLLILFIFILFQRLWKYRRLLQPRE